MKAIRTKRSIYVVVNEEPLEIIRVANCPRRKRWQKNERPRYASQKTLDRILSHDYEITDIDVSNLDDIIVKLNEQRDAQIAIMRQSQAKAQEKQLAQLAAWLDEAKDADGVIPATYENVKLLLRWLNAQNWGGWQLPRLSIAYSCNQYDCDGKTATTITLDEAIQTTDSEWHKAFVYGAPRGHLAKYERI